MLNKFDVCCIDIFNDTLFYNSNCVLINDGNKVILNLSETQISKLNAANLNKGVGKTGQVYSVSSM